jgi:hypothetical protein
MYAWLKNGAAEILQAQFPDDKRVTAKTDVYSGKKYIVIGADVYDPSLDLSFLKKFIEKITLKDWIYGRYIPQGTYHHAGATLVAKFWPAIDEHRASISISATAPDLEKLRSIYSLALQGKIFPKENWDKNVSRVSWHGIFRPLLHAWQLLANAISGRNAKPNN